MNTPATRETIPLRYDDSYNAGYNQGWIQAQQQTTSPTIRVDYGRVVSELDDWQLWQKRSMSMQSILVMVIFAALAIMVVIGLGIILVNWIIVTGVKLYILIAPVALIGILGYLWGKRWG